MLQIELWRDDGTLLHEFSDPDKHMTVCSIPKFHPKADVVFGGNSTGKMFYFK
jgi:hypothetical protein